MAEIKLRPCPFCGGEAVFKIQKICSVSALLAAEIEVECSECKIRLPGRYYLFVNENENGEFSLTSDQQKAADAWNRRTC